MPEHPHLCPGIQQPPQQNLALWLLFIKNSLWPGPNPILFLIFSKFSFLHLHLCLPPLVPTHTTIPSLPQVGCSQCCTELWGSAVMWLLNENNLVSCTDTGLSGPIKPYIRAEQVCARTDTGRGLPSSSPAPDIPSPASTPPAAAADSHLTLVFCRGHIYPSLDYNKEH